MAPSEPFLPSVTKSQHPEIPLGGTSSIVEEVKTFAPAAIPDRALWGIAGWHEGEFEAFIELAEAPMTHETVIRICAGAQNGRASRKNDLLSLATCEAES